MTLKEWIAGQNTKDTTTLLHRVHAKKQTGVTPSSIVEKLRPSQRVADEKAWTTSLSREKGLIQTALRLAGIEMGVLTGNTTESVDEGLTPIFAPSLAEENGWGDVTANQIETTHVAVSLIAKEE